MKQLKLEAFIIMTKREILKFLERKQQEKISAICDEYLALREQLLQKVYAELGLPALADKIHSLLAEAGRLWADWQKEHEYLDYITCHHNYYSLSGLIDGYTSSETTTLDKLVNDDIRVLPEDVRNACKEYNVHRECVRNTFNTVITTVQEMKSAKQAAIYLKELGFDLSEIGKPAEPAQTALMVPVDTRFLFVNAA